MKKILALTVVLAVSVFASMAFAQTCTTIQSGTLYASDNSLIETGFDQWGYNYQAHMFNGGYCDAYRDATWCQEWKDVDLLMKWNDAWLSNQDCDGDGKLDRHYGYPSYKGSGAWETNHQKGTYPDVYGKKQRWEYFVKIVAVPADATCDGMVSSCADGAMWYAPGNIPIGPSIWGEFAIIQEVYNDTGTGEHGVLYVSPYSAGFGAYSPKD